MVPTIKKWILDTKQKKNYIIHGTAFKKEKRQKAKTGLLRTQCGFGFFIY